MKAMTFYIVGYLLELDIESNNSPIKTFPFGKHIWPTITHGHLEINRLLHYSND
jgi:hypothetical protein